MQNYNDYSEIQKASMLHKYYVEEKKSINQIAEMYNLYANKIRRDLKKYNIPIRNKSEAQKNALASGSAAHPTQGKERDEATKNKIGKSLMQSWDSLSDKELKRRKDTARKNWENLSEDEKQMRHNAANVAIRETSKVGSKLEQYLLEELVAAGYRVEPHKEQLLSNTKLHIDLFLSGANIAIEVDGPSHFSPVWGEEALARAQEYDRKKTGLLIGKGLKLIRVKQTRDFSKSRAAIIFERLVQAISDIEKKQDNYIEIGDE